LLTDAAETDLAELWAYIALEASEAVATRFLDAVENTFRPLLHSPQIGAKRDMFAPGLRVTFYGAYAIYYTATAEHLVIVRVLHGARDTAALAERGGFN
jgi:toxin ParE1/3/4